MFTPNRDLFLRDQVPEHFKELFIVSGYRSPGSSLKQCTLSVFKATNETLNFWTHFLPAVYYWYVTYHMSWELDFQSDSYTWPLVSYMLAVCVFPITSAIAHVFNTLSDRARHICFFFDYAALSIFTMGASIAYKAYIFPDALINGTFHTIFLPVAVINAILSLAISCQTRFMANSLKKKMMRVSAFAIPYVFDSAPMIYRILYCTPDESNARALVPHTYQFIFAFVAAAMYISHVPERYFPATFDIVGHSHQIFHVFTIIAVHLQISGLTHDLLDRKEYLIHHDVIPSAWTSILLMATVLLIDSMVLLWFILKICHVTPEEPAWRHLYGDKELHQVHGNSLIPCLRPSKFMMQTNRKSNQTSIQKSDQTYMDNSKDSHVVISKETSIDKMKEVVQENTAYQRKSNKAVTENGNEILIVNRNEGSNLSGYSKSSENGCMSGDHLKSG